MQAVEVEVVLGELAASQWGLFTALQAQHAGVSRVRLSRLAEAGALVRLAHGIYALRGAMSSDRLELRAVWLGLDPTRLASDRLGDGSTGAVVSHASAADLYGFGDLDADRHEFTTPSRKQTRRPDVRLHRSVLDPSDVTLYNGLPVTTPERIVVDLLTAGHDGEHVAGVLASAVRDHRIDLHRLAPRLEPFAARFGFPHRNGQQLMDHLLELGGVSDLIAAEQLVDVARASNRTVGDFLASAVNRRAAEVVTSIMQNPAVRDALVHQNNHMQELIASVLSNATPVAPTLQALKGLQLTGEVTAPPKSRQLAEVAETLPIRRAQESPT